MLTWHQLGFSDKPVGVLNVAGYYDGLLSFFDAAVAEGFVSADSRRIVLAGDSAGALLDAMAAYTPPPSLIAKLKAQAAAPDAAPQQFL